MSICVVLELPFTTYKDLPLAIEEAALCNKRLMETPSLLIGTWADFLSKDGDSCLICEWFSSMYHNIETLSIVELHSNLGVVSARECSACGWLIPDLPSVMSPYNLEDLPLYIEGT
jgi:hypothetical protein